jgi:ribosomal protein S18 acetylase RimI-like enzyme
MAGHRAAGEFDPSLWHVVVAPGGIPAGVLLTTAAPQHEALEVVYLGVSPAFRGRRLGKALVRLAMHQAAARKIDRVTLAVDGGNVPAQRLYYGAGFARVHARDALIADLRALGAPTQAPQTTITPQV